MCEVPVTKTATILVLAAVVFLGVDPMSRADDRLIPANLTESQKANIKKFLASVEKPKQFLPEKAKLVGSAPSDLGVGAEPGAEIRQYLAAVIPYTAKDRKRGPEKAEILWYRPNPKKGQPGVTVRRVLDLTTGAAVGDPEVLFNHATPLTVEELNEAIKLARDKYPAAADLYATTEAKDVEVAPLVQVITATGQADGAVGDRVVSLQLRKKGTNKRLAVMVNLTRQTVRDPNAP